MLTKYCQTFQASRQREQVITNFKISLSTSRFKQSGVQLDIEGVLMGNIIVHQAFGCHSSQKAVDFAKEQHYKDYSLSFTGHSLGAWLAELSVFYCHKSFDFPIKSSQISKGYLKNILLGISENIPVKVRKTIESLVTHDLKYILPLFDTVSGKPECKKVEKWPSISYDKREFNNNSTNFTALNKLPQLIESIFPSLWTKILKYGFKIAGSMYEWKNTTADSIFHLFTNNLKYFKCII